MARVRLIAIVPHTTHDYHGAQITHDVGATYDVDETDVENLIALGFAARAPDSPPPPAAPAPAENPAPTSPPAKPATRRK